jgi:hypothetical protein
MENTCTLGKSLPTLPALATAPHGFRMDTAASLILSGGKHMLLSLSHAVLTRSLELYLLHP